MEAIIKKIELKKFINKYYFKIYLTDINGYNYVIDKPFLSSAINFRKQVFGLMSACGSYDLMTLATNNPVHKRIVGYYMNGLKILENENNEWFSYDLNKSEYTCDKIAKNKVELLESLIKNNISSMTKDEGEISNIESKSGIFSLLFNTESTSTFFLCGQQIYYGFGYPINIGDPNNIEYTKEAAKIYTSFVVSLMNFYGINDLLHFGGNTDKLPVVEINFNNNNEIQTITNPTTGLGFSINKGYNIVNIFDKEKIR